MKTLGCRLNEAELEMWAQGFLQAGHRITQDIYAADLIVLNSCAVTQEAVRKSRQSLRRIHHDNPHAKLIISGCYATLHPDEAAQSLGVDLVIGNKDKDKLVALSLSELNMESMPAMAAEPGETSLFSRGRQRAFVKVQDGCRYRCTFCIVTDARGEERSRPIPVVIDEINTLQQQGINEVILTGVHLGGYGADINCTLAELIQSILAATDMPRIRLGSLEPWDLPEKFLQLFSNPRLMPHLHLPLQSGSNTVLRRMARRCKTEQFSRIAEQARKYIPDFNLTTDIIVGFPGETDQEWQESFDFIDQTGFGHVHIFTYSPRKGTKAAALSGQVKNTLKKSRSRQLHELTATMKEKNFEKYLGMTFPVLWERRKRITGEEKHQVFGYTPNYLRVVCQTSGENSLENKIFPAKLLSFNEGVIKSSIIDHYDNI